MVVKIQENIAIKCANLQLKSRINFQGFVYWILLSTCTTGNLWTINCFLLTIRFKVGLYYPTEEQIGQKKVYFPAQ